MNPFDNFDRNFKRTATGFGVAAILLFVINLCFVLVVAWVCGSALTSGIKAGTSNCGQTYSVESVFSGDWFCPKKEK